jgi:hypothetical protein
MYRTGRARQHLGVESAIGGVVNEPSAVPSCSSHAFSAAAWISGKDSGGSFASGLRRCELHDRQNVSIVRVELFDAAPAMMPS